MARVTVTSGGGSARYRSRCQTCDGYGDIKKLRGVWMCLPCRVNSTTIYAADQTIANCVGTASPKAHRAIERKNTAEQEIKNRRAGITPTAVSVAPIRKSRPFRRAPEAGASNLARTNADAAGGRASDSQSNPVRQKQRRRRQFEVVKTESSGRAQTSRTGVAAQPKPETFESSLTKLQERWNSRLD